MKTDKSTKFIMRCLLVRHCVPLVRHCERSEATPGVYFNTPKKQQASGQSRFLQRLLWALLLQVSVHQTASAFFHPCSISLQADPPLPANIATQQAMGAVIYQGQLTWTYDQCYSLINLYFLSGAPLVYAKGEGTYALLTGTSTPQPIWGVSGLTVQADPPVFGSNFINTKDHQVNSTLSTQYNTYFMDSQVLNMSFQDTYSSEWKFPPVSFSVSQTITIKASAAKVTGRFPDPKDGGPLIDLQLLGRFKDACRDGPWTMPIYFAGCPLWPIEAWKLKPWIDTLRAGRLDGTRIVNTPQVPTIGGATTTVVQDCKPVLRSSITIPNLKKP
jgi:hypothetical protein